ncbi:ABC transporter permease [Flavisolibacter sp. BT320]|nr:ABC transporter permease [Flavisolibacter longurius]
MSLLIALRSEIIKTKRTASFYFTLLGAAPVPAIFLLNVLTGGGDLKDTRNDPLNAIFELGLERSGLIFFPMFVILVCTLLPQIEYRNHTWKQVMASPLTRASVFGAKFLNIQALILLFLATSLLYLGVVIIIIHFAMPDLQLLQQPFNGLLVLQNAFDLYVCLLAVSAIQFWIGMRSKNFIVPVAIGFVMWLTGTFLTMEYKSDLSVYFPYSYQAFPIVSVFKSHLQEVQLISLGYTAFFLLLGFLDFKRKAVSK